MISNLPLYNSRIIDTYLKLIRTRYSHVNISDLLVFAGMESYEVADQGHWFTQEQINRFYERLVQLTGNEGIAREAGRYAAAPATMGMVRRYTLSLMGATKAFELFGRLSSTVTRSCHYESHALSSNRVEMVVSPLSGIEEQPFQCQNRIGFFEAFVSLLHGDLPTIEHPECVFQGGNCCRYIISWKRSFSSRCRTIRNYLFIPLAVLFGAGVWYSPNLVNEASLGGLVGSILLLSLLANFREKHELLNKLNDLKESSDQALEQINTNYSNALLTNELGQAISRQTDIDDILASVIQVLENRLDFDRGLILLANNDRTKLVFRAGFGYAGELLELLEQTTFRLNRVESQGVFVVSFREQRPFLINDLNDIEGALTLRSLSFAKKIGVKSFICCPIICDGESIGVLAVDNVNSKRPLVQTDMSLLMGIAPVIGVSIRNAELLIAKTRQFDSLLQVMAATIDARDPLTAGHSEKVTDYALGICDELGLNKEFREMVRVAALLHDYGKIGVPDSVLKKEGRLTEIEYEVVKAHSNRTRDILEQINFEGIYQQVPEIAAAHHEKMDGSGYPKGLKGKQIPLAARIIAVADFFEAITAKRHYRDPMPLEEAYRLLNEGSGSHFEKKIVDALISYYNKSHKPDQNKYPRLVKPA